MPVAPVNITSIKGLIPVIDHKKIPDVHVLDGQNFYIDGDGPVSGFGHSIIGYKRIVEAGNVQSFEISDRAETFIFTNSGVFVFDVETTRLIPVYLFTSAVTTEFPWSYALVGNVHYFARKGLGGILSYYQPTNEWTLFTPVSVAGTIFACIESGGRLILLTEIADYWSAIDDGTDFTTSLVTGAGAQLLSKLGSVDLTSPLGLLSLPDGFLIYTTLGIMKAQTVDGATQFRHTVISRKHIPINPFCVIEVEEKQHVMLTRTGFFATTGDVPEEWQPVMGEYFHRKLLPQFDLYNNQNSFRLHYDFNLKWFFVSVSQSQADYAYNYAWMLYTPTNEWGSFNTPHRGFLNLHFTSGAFTGFNFCFVDYVGTLLRFDENSGIETYLGEASIWNYEYRPEAEIEARIQDSVFIFAASVYFHTQDESAFIDSGVYDLQQELFEVLAPGTSTTDEAAADEAGTYTFSTFLSLVPAIRLVYVALLPAEYGTLNAYVDIGLVRLTDDQGFDRMSFTPVIAVGMLDSAAGDDVEDWMDETTFPGEITEDWLTMPDSIEDWGSGVSGTTEYDFETVSTIDGYSQIENGDSVPEFIRQDGRMRYYSCNNMGIYHKLRFTAQESGQNFHLKTLDFDLHKAGMWI